jgi:uncharacterized repeat protein (TIGR03809 family)
LIRPGCVASVFLFASFLMTHRLDVACSRELCERWCALAERRLAHLTELFESGRWRRYYSEHALLENFREAKAAVKIWHALSRGESIASTVEIGPARAVDDAVFELPLQPAAAAEVVERIEPAVALVPAIETTFVESDIVLPEDIVLWQLPPPEPRIDLAALEQALSVGIEEEAEPGPLVDIDAIERRYPALRHAL